MAREWDGRNCLILVLLCSFSILISPIVFMKLLFVLYSAILMSFQAIKVVGSIISFISVALSLSVGFQVI